MLTEFDDPRAFADRVRDFLVAREAENCVELGVLSQLTNNGPAGTRGETLGTPRLWLVEDDHGSIDALFTQANKDRALVTRGSTGAMRAIAAHLHEIGWREKSINGNSPSVRELVKEYSRLTGRVGKCATKLRTFQLTRVVPPRSSPGRMRACDDRDFDCLKKWTVEFARDVGDEAGESEGERWAKMLLESKRGWFWIDENNSPVSMAAHAGPTPNGIRVNFVYTPPQSRGKGYASNLVAALSQHHLHAGKRLIFLNTDQANPTSNSIYQKIGYRPVCDAERWDF